MSAQGYGATLDQQEPSVTPNVKDQHLLKSPGGNQENDQNGIKNIFSRKSKYPVSVFFILGSEFCERFTYYGLRTVLVLYLTGWLGINTNTATALYHSFSFLAYFSPVLGAIIADGYLGRYRTILYVSTVYGIGCAVLSLTAFPPPELPGPMIGLLLIALGTGGIKPCVVTFGGDQFSADQVEERSTFFSTFYFMINLGSVLSTFLTPILRADVHCVGNSCYPLAFGVPALLMLTALLIFFAGRKSYKHVPVTGSLFSRVSACILHAIHMRFKYRRYQEEKTHWLDYAGDKFEMPFIEDVKRLLKVLWLFLPLPMFWALFNQQGSRWTLQAVQLDGRMGSFGRLKPDQLQALNPLLIILLIPVFERLVYPLLHRFRIPNRPLQRMVAGMTFSILAFCVAGLIQIKIDMLKEPTLPGNKAGYTFINTVPCDLTIQSTPSLLPDSVAARGAGTKHLEITCANTGTHLDSVITLDEGVSSRLVITLNRLSNSLQLEMGAREAEATVVSVTANNVSNFMDFEPGRYTISVPRNDTGGHPTWLKIGSPITLGGGGVYSVALLHSSAQGNLSETEVLVYNTVKENTLSMGLMVPQYVIITVGEILFSVSGLGFAYTQAPESLRSVLQAAWLLTTAFGDLIVVFIAEVRLVPSQVAEFFLFAALMAADTIIFAIMGCFYVYTNIESTDTALSDETRLVDSEHEDVPLQERNGSIK
ncbi:hypothetical protein BaRGS_00007776 [Batillaria attramentaria]|uniref:Uncharacterized protein n=1 Tax=Batillaria attramentaria TaxID=370345 RepID=A0ABD0LNN2_9CAEN